MSSSGPAKKHIEVYERWYQRHAQMTAPRDESGRALVGGLDPVDYSSQRHALGAIEYCMLWDFVSYCANGSE